MPVVGTNTAANAALLYLNKNSAAQEASLSHLSSGSKIVKASDDAAGLAVATRLNSDISVLSQAAVNAQQGQSVLNVADGALANIADILQRMKSLAAQSMSGSVDAESRAYIDAEYQQLITEVDQIVDTTRFNGIQLIDSTYDESYLVGTDGATDTIQVTLDFDIDAAGSLAADLLTSTDAQTASGEIDTMIDTLATARSTVGSYQSRFGFRQDVINTSIENLDAAKSAIMDTDIAAEQSNFTTQQVLTEVATAALAQANSMKSSLLTLVR